MTRISIAVALVALAAFASGSSALAQQDAPPPGYPAVFRGAVTDPRATQTLNVSLNLAESYDDNLTAATAGPTAALTPQKAGGLYTEFAPQVDFSTRGDRLQFNAIGGSDLRYYGNLHRAYAMNHNLGAGMTAKVTDSTSLSITQTASYAPAYLYALFATPASENVAGLLPGGADYQATSEESFAFGTNVSVTHSMTPRATLDFHGAYRYTNFVGDVPGYFDLNSSDGGVRWTYNADRNVKLRIGYTYRNTQISRTLRPVEHDLDIGIDYTKPLSRTRKSLIGVSFGPALISGALAPADPSATMHYGLIGSAFFDRQVSRTWHMRADVNRSLSYIEGFAGPVYNNGATVGANGFLNHRTDLSFSAAYAVGDMAAQNQQAQFRTYTGDARLRIALAHEWAAYVEALVYDYNFDRALLLVPGVPSNLNRSVVRVGLTLWLPVRSR